jgi:hypothetical protein
VLNARPELTGSDGAEEYAECPGWIPAGFFGPAWAGAARFFSLLVVADTRRWIDSTRFWSAARISAWDGGFP